MRSERRRWTSHRSSKARSTLEKSEYADQSRKAAPTIPARAAWVLRTNRSRYGSIVDRAPTARFSSRNSCTSAEIRSIPVKACTTEKATTSAGASAKSEM